MAINSKNFREEWAFLADKMVFIACSGGVDSIALTNLVGKFCPNITLLHVNYKLRGKDSDEDEQFVENFAQEHKYKFESLRVNTEEILRNKKGNLQELARKIRYEWFETFLKNEKSVLLLGHHQDDQIESFYLNLARKSGISGLSCMLKQMPPYYRPLLDFDKVQIYDYAKTQKLSWREDQSNKTNKYRRNVLRNEILPLLHAEIPDLKDSILYLISIFQANRQMSEVSAEKLCQEIRKKGDILLDTWKILSDEQRLYILKSFNYTPSQLKEFVKLVTAQKGKIIHSKNYTVTKERNSLHFKKRELGELLPKLAIVHVPYLPEEFDKNCIFLDKSKIEGELHIRLWEKSDRIASLGLNGSQLVSDIIRDAQTPSALRKSICVVHDDQRIHWVVGLKIGRTAIADKKSTHIIRIALKH